MIWENLKMALVSLRGAKLRSFLTMLGIIIGVASVTSVLAIGQGVKHSVAGQVEEFGTNVIQINPGKAFSTDEEGNQSGFNPTAAFGSSTLTEDDIATVQKLSQIEAAAPAMLVSGIATAGDKTANNGFILGTTSDYVKAVKIDLAKGEFFKSKSTSDLVIGSSIAKQLFGSETAGLGQTVSIRGENFKVVGIAKKPKEGLNLGPGLDSVIFMPFTTAKVINKGNAQINEIDAKVRSAEEIKSTQQQIKKLIKQNHGGQDDFTVLTAQEQLKIFDRILAILTSFVAAIAAISLLVGGVGVMNIMLVSVTERTREIGVRKAIGATRRMILTQFLIEAITISILGGGLGLLLAYGQGLLVKRLAKITPVFSPSVMAVAFVISIVIGVIFGLAPAIKAARKRPIEALRYE